MRRRLQPLQEDGDSCQHETCAIEIDIAGKDLKLDDRQTEKQKNRQQRGKFFFAHQPRYFIDRARSNDAGENVDQADERLNAGG